MFEKYTEVTELFKSVAFILMNLHSLAPSNVYVVYFLLRLDRKLQGRKLVRIDNIQNKLE